MTKFIYQELRRTLYTILELASDDYCGLYETYWSLPEGEVYNEELGLQKAYSLETAMKLNKALCLQGFVELVRSINRNIEKCTNLDQLEIVSNYKPFAMFDDDGYALSATPKGATLRVRLLRRYRGE